LNLIFVFAGRISNYIVYVHSLEELFLFSLILMKKIKRRNHIGD